MLSDVERRRWRQCGVRLLASDDTPWLLVLRFSSARTTRTRSHGHGCASATNTTCCSTPSGRPIWPESTACIHASTPPPCPHSPQLRTKATTTFRPTDGTRTGPPRAQRKPGFTTPSPIGLGLTATSLAWATAAGHAAAHAYRSAISHTPSASSPVTSIAARLQMVFMYLVWRGESGVNRGVESPSCNWLEVPAVRSCQSPVQTWLVRT